MNFEQQRKQAKELLRVFRAGGAAGRFLRHHPRARGLSAGEALALSMTLADAQLVVAREAGFRTWSQLKAELEVTDPLRRAVTDGDLAGVRRALAARPPLWKKRGPLEIAVERDRREVAALLLAARAWPDHAGRRWGRGGGCLHAALLLGRSEALLETLIDGGASVHARDRDGRTPLAIAVRTSHPGAELLRRRGARDKDVYPVDRALGACVRGEMVERLSEFVRSDHQHLPWAVRFRHDHALPALLALGLDPGVPDDDGETALHLAVERSADALVEQLLSAGAPVDARNFRNRTALQLAEGNPLAERLRRAGARDLGDADHPELFERAVEAVQSGDLEGLRALLEAQPDLVRARSPRGHHATLLHYLAANGVENPRCPPNAPAVAELLLARGADPHAASFVYHSGAAETALALAVSSVFPEQVGVMEPLILALVRGGAAPDVGGARRSALAPLVKAGAQVDLCLAAALGLQEDFDRLLHPDGTLGPGAKLGPALRLPDQEIKGWALLVACNRGHLPMVERLLAAGAPLDARDAEGMTPLHQAVWDAQLDVVKLLLNRGAPLEVPNLYGGTPLDFLVWVVRNQRKPDRDYAGAARLLIGAGADLDAVEGVPTGCEEFDAAFGAPSPATT